MAINGSTDSIDKIMGTSTIESSNHPEMDHSGFDPDHEDACPPEAPRCLMLSDMPEEILEHILGFLSPYREMEMAKLVSKQWNRVIQTTVKQKKRKFLQSLSRCDVQWTEIHKDKRQSISERGYIGITDRFSHSAAYYNGFMYVFGGCTSTSTTFNDLWSFDLTNRKWVRPVAMGTYPSPKACATMVVYKGNLVLFGGWSHPIPYPLHQSAHYFSELHMYSPMTNRWANVHSLGQEPEALGGHSASVAGDLMVVFGGSPRPGMGTNNLWVFNFLKTSWTLQPVAGDAVPEPRYGQFQTTLDDRHILIMGGCVGQNRVYTDVWLLTLEPASPWRWTKLTVECPELGAPQTWCHAACRVNNLVVVVAKSNSQRQTKVVKKPKKKRQEQSKYAAASSSSSQSSSSSSSSPMQAKVMGTERVTLFDPVSSGRMQGVYIHPKLQPQPKRGAAAAAESSQAKEASIISPKLNNVGKSTKASSPAEGAIPGPSKEASTFTEHDSKSSHNLSKFSSEHRSPSLTPTESCSSLASSSSSSKVGGMSAAANLSHQALREPSSLDVSCAPPQGNSLLALQQRLHRECLNLPDPDDHHHNPRYSRALGGGGFRSDNDDDYDGRSMPEGYFHRLHNRWMEGQASVDASRENNISMQPSSSQSGPSSPSVSISTEKSQFCEGLVNDGASCSHQSHSKLNAGENSNSIGLHQASVRLQQPMASECHTSRQCQRREGHAMPSIRPNATSNRQRQLEALQRQEELLRSKSRALAAARGRQHQAQPVPPHGQEEAPRQQHQQENNRLAAERAGAHRQDELREEDNQGSKKRIGQYENDDDSDDNDDDGDPSSPTQIPSKNKMDVHVLDISRALTERVVCWAPLSELQPPGAPDETICCSLVEGRGELALFGGVRRDMTGADIGPAGVSNMAVSRLYLLSPG